MELLSRTCSSCQIEKSLSEYFRDKNLKEGREYQCKSCVKQYNSFSLPLSIKHKFGRLKIKARDSNIPVLITEDEYAKLIKHRKCYYCDASTMTEMGGELNRVDNTKPYTIDNLKNCCKICNRLMCNFTITELKSRLIKIYRRI
jgi:hypothetical protein